MYYEDDPPASAGCARGALYIAIALVLLGGLAYWGLNRGLTNAADQLNPFDGQEFAISNPFQPAPTQISVDRAAVVRQMQALSRLETYTYLTEQVITAERGGSQFYNFFLGDKLLLIASGEVIAGFDLNKLNEGDVVVSPDGSSVTVTLPPAEVLVSRLDNTKTQVYSQETGIFTKGDPGLESEARRVAEQRIVEAACDAGILSRAAEQGRLAVEGLVKSFGFDNVTVNASPGSCAAPVVVPAASVAPSP